MRLKRQRIDFPGGPAGYLDLGPMEPAGPALLPVVLIHGFAGDALTWQFVLPHLAHRRRVVALDLPGHGGSTQQVGDGRLPGLADWLRRALDALGLPRAHLVGHSMGGKVALLAAQAMPDRVASLALLAPAGIAPAVDLGLLQDTLNARTAAEATACVAALFAAPHPLIEAMGKALLARVAGPVSPEPLWTILNAAFSGPDYWDAIDWDALPMRHMAIWGDADRLVPLPDARRLPRGERTKILPRVGHAPQLETPSVVNGLLDDFLAMD